jgi:ArsR family transcriptional regulator
MVDTETSECRALINNNIKHEHGKCSPFIALGGEAVDCVVVGGIGGGALGKLKEMGADVFKAASGTIRENLEHLKKDELSRFSPAHSCGSGGGCSHH